MAKLLHLTFCVVLAAVVFDFAYAVCPTCASTGSTCAAYSTLVDCYKTMTVANQCTALEAAGADTSRAALEITLAAAGCSGAGTLMTSLGFVLVLTSLAYFFNGNKL